MCVTCGCSDDSATKMTSTAVHSHEHDHTHEHEHKHDHTHEPTSMQKGRVITLEEKILAKNDHIAEHNREWFESVNVLALNLVSSPGSGKTALLERTISDLKNKVEIAVLEGDQATSNDAERIRRAGCSVLQINTGAGCHLDASMIASALKELKPTHNSLLLIENVGNLVCPALFDLGEKHKVVVLSITEGEDKPIKYPHMFRAAEIMLLNKIDLLPHLNFDIEACKQYALSVNPKLKIIEVSATTGQGLEQWYEWLMAGIAC
ncbi:MAG: hydrogenase nickel incorporation protein HypB [Candidatus Obscuribacterales bacterium]